METLSLHWKLFLAFFKTGLFSWGGGTAMLALMESECVRRYEWITPERFGELVSVNAAVPGVFAIKFAGYVGWQQAGLLGAITSCISVCLPGVLIFIPLFVYIQRWKENTYFMKFLYGIQFGAAGMILYSVFKVLPKVDTHSHVLYFGLLITASVTISLRYGFNPVYAIILAGVIGFICF